MIVVSAPKFNGLAVGEVNINMMSTTVSLKAKAAFVNTKTGATHGWTQGEGDVWSPATIAKMRELLSLMEEDLCRLHFEDSQSPTKNPAVDEKSPAGLGGLGEHVSGNGEQL